MVRKIKVRGICLVCKATRPLEGPPCRFCGMFLALATNRNAPTMDAAIAGALLPGRMNLMKKALVEFFRSKLAEFGRIRHQSMSASAEAHKLLT